MIGFVLVLGFILLVLGSAFLLMWLLIEGVWALYDWWLYGRD